MGHFGQICRHGNGSSLGLKFAAEFANWSRQNKTTNKWAKLAEGRPREPLSSAHEATKRGANAIWKERPPSTSGGVSVRVRVFGACRPIGCRPETVRRPQCAMLEEASLRQSHRARPLESEHWSSPLVPVPISGGKIKAPGRFWAVRVLCLFAQCSRGTGHRSPLTTGFVESGWPMEVE